MEAGRRHAIKSTLEGGRRDMITMKKKWSTRLLVSYLPVYLAITSAIIIMLFWVITRSARNDIQAANRALVRQVQYNVDDITNRIDRSTIKNLYLNKEVATALSGVAQEGESPYYTRYKLFDEITDFLISNNDACSVYLLNIGEGKILSNYGLSSLADFYDRAFIQDFAMQVPFAQWSGIREIENPYESQQTQRLVSLVRVVSDNGIIVVNVPQYKLELSLSELQAADVHTIRLTDRQGTPIVSLNDQNVAQYRELNQGETGSGWRISGGMNQSPQLRLVEIGSLVWMAVSIIITAVGAISIYHATKRNYAPVAAIMDDLQQMDHIQPLLKEKTESEFHLISKAIHTYSDLVDDYQHNRQGRELLLGKSVLPKGQRGGPYTVLAVDVDRRQHPADNMLEVYGRMQQYILDQWQQEGGDVRALWSGWMTQNRLAVVIANADAQQIADHAKAFSDWVHAQCGIYAAVGISDANCGESALAAAYQQADLALHHKSVFPKGAVIRYDPKYESSQPMPADNGRMIRSVITLLQNADEQWLSVYEKWHEEFSAGEPSNAEVEQQYRRLLEVLDLSMHQQQAAVLISAWNNLVKPKLQDTLTNEEYLADIFRGFRDGLTGLFDQYAALKNRQQGSKTLSSIQQLMDQNYEDPDFSLTVMAEILGMNPNYISTLIKDETGTTFTKIITQKRMDRAKELLTENKMPIAQIAEKLGYQSTISFHRTFKQTTGVTPGEYRKNALMGKHTEGEEEK